MDFRNSKPRPNHKMYLEILRRMTPEQRLKKAFELGELGRSLLVAGLRDQFPDSTGAQIHQLMLKRLKQCHNRSY